MFQFPVLMGGDFGRKKKKRALSEAKLYQGSRDELCLCLLVIKKATKPQENKVQIARKLQNYKHENN